MKNAWIIGPGLSIGGMTALALSGAGYRLGFWHFRLGFTLMTAAAVCGGAGLLLSALFIGRRGGANALLMAGVVLGAASAALPAFWMAKAKKVPAIHDISTDTSNPPLFVAILPLRKDAPNPPEYGGPEIAALQKAAYPDIAPLKLDAPPSAAFDKAVKAAEDLGWEIAGTDPKTGRIEATDTTFWYGFKDDVVIRVSPDGAGSRVDARSVSRVGKSDVGANAARIRILFKRLRGG